MNYWNRLLFALMLALALGARGQTGFSFNPIFGDNMVLQRGPSTTIYGTYTNGPPNRTAKIFFNSKLGSKLVAKDIKPDPVTGVWRAALDLVSAGSNGTIEISWSEGVFAKPSSQRLNNITIGDVWLFAGWDSQGVSGRWTEDISKASKARGVVRFWDLRTTGVGPPWPEWEDWPDDANAERFRDTVLRRAVLAEKLGGYVGIVLAPPSALETGLADPTRPFIGEIPDKPDFMHKGIEKARQWRSQMLIDNKHAGIVTNIPPIIDYDAPAFVPFEAFSPLQFPAQAFTFRAAIWPAHAADRGAPAPPRLDSTR
jgi:hypothetical protein